MKLTGIMWIRNPQRNPSRASFSAPKWLWSLAGKTWTPGAWTHQGASSLKCLTPWLWWFEGWAECGQLSAVPMCGLPLWLEVERLTALGWFPRGKFMKGILPRESIWKEEGAPWSFLTKLLQVKYPSFSMFVDLPTNFKTISDSGGKEFSFPS